ncbi:DNA polymerase III subunit alpha [Xenorhabdus szentirmaii]|uniref:DNA polymerase III subunit alpha n=1 Tax=Xenorhabdus szentirmaii DSM 16338 TaxID=1427518 RepID=W1ITX2_9GAMM|nr:DNA polymerase III subunit alpha [Xenorhabdus szentirmaii]PHM30591.1 DNA polymerase III subunit alpha [Xenorhabdus szentirmaii DSM 16338]CDL81066.1 DNA polymerase III subunit alpha [Xenorhabdus szentirmaii DSM 16338]
MQALLVRTDFSLGESTIKAANAVQIAKDKGYKAIISADTMNISAVIPMQTAASEDVSVILGTRLIIVDNPFIESENKERKEKGEELLPIDRDFGYSFIAMAKNEQGFSDLCSLLSYGYERNQFYKIPRLDLSQVIETHSKGNIVLTTADFDSVFRRRDHVAVMEKLASVNREDLYAAVYPMNSPFFDQINIKSSITAETLSLKRVAFYPAYYESSDDADLKDIAYQVCNNVKSDQVHRMRIPYVRDNAINDRFHLLKHLKEFNERTGTAVSPAMVSTIQDEIIGKCNYRWHKMGIALPKMAEDEATTLKTLAIDGLKAKLVGKSFGYTPPKTQWPEYISRMKYELEVLTRLGFCGYFLMVSDLMQHSIKTKIPVGAGRGSVGGSLVAWCVGITDVDPIRHGLLFERFINPERLDLPDADLDFSQSKRHLAIKYLYEKYGEDYVAGIVNYSYLGAASAIRDSARIFNVPTADLAVSKEVGWAVKEGDDLPLEELRSELASLDKYATKYPKAFESACKLKNMMRSYGRHAAGMIVSSVPIRERAVIERRGDERVINWDKRHCEDMGLIKLDVLGLATLDLLQLAVDYIDERHGAGVVRLNEVSLDESKVMENFANGRTKGVFQLESAPMRNLLKDLGGGVDPISFETIVATTALFRPGPIQSGMLDTFVSVAKGFSEPASLHPKLDELTRETNGVILYQEQTMKTVQILGGFTLAEADAVRKAIGKKDAAKMASMGELFKAQAGAGWIDVLFEDGSIMTVHRAEHFKCGDTKLTIENALGSEVEIRIEGKLVKGVIVGSEQAGLTKEKANEIWNALEKNGAYQFNKSHSVAYTLISYQSMWLKTFYPAEFFAAAITILGEDKHQDLVADALDYGISILPPDINISSHRMEIRDIDGGPTLFAPFSAVKGCSSNGSNAIVEARNKLGGKFESKTQFVEVVNKRSCNARVIESLDLVGAFASIEADQPPASDESRRKNQAELMGNLVIEAVKTSREFVMDEKKNANISLLMNRISSETGLTDSLVRPRTGRKPKFMIILDGASKSDVNNGIFMESGYNEFKAILTNAGFLMGDIYITGVLKKQKDEGAKTYSKEDISAFTDYMKAELEIAKPTYILACGSLASSLFNNKSKPSDLVGRKEYFAGMDATVFYAFNPNILYFRPEEDEKLIKIVEEVATTVNEN